MSKKHALTNEYKASLKEIADRLPVPEQVGRKPLLGAQLLQDHPELRDQKGKPLDPEKMYYVGSPVESVNHLRRLCHAFEEGGQAAVVAYLMPYEAFLVSPEQADALLMAQ